jgi:hypothetical protein
MEIYVFKRNVSLERGGGDCSEILKWRLSLSKHSMRVERYGNRVCVSVFSCRKA